MVHNSNYRCSEEVIVERISNLFKKIIDYGFSKIPISIKKEKGESIIKDIAESQREFNSYLDLIGNTLRCRIESINKILTFVEALDGLEACSNKGLLKYLETFISPPLFGYFMDAKRLLDLTKKMKSQQHILKRLLEFPDETTKRIGILFDLTGNRDISDYFEELFERIKKGELNKANEMVKTLEKKFNEKNIK